MANILKRDKQEAVIQCLCNGASIRATERIVGVHRDTATRFMVRVGQGCARLLDERMVNLPCKRVQVDEIWTYVNQKQKNVRSRAERYERGDFWIWTAIDSDSKLIPSYRVGKRDKADAQAFCHDLAGRMANRVQLSSDAYTSYIESIWEAFGGGNVDYGQIVKSYEAEPIGPGRYAPPKVAHVERSIEFGRPDPKYISTSHIERMNLTTRTHMARLARLSLAFSKKRENLEAATAMHYAHYNYCKVHGTLKATPAEAIGLETRPWTVGEFIDAALEA